MNLARIAATVLVFHLLSAPTAKAAGDFLEESPAPFSLTPVTPNGVIGLAAPVVATAQMPIPAPAAPPIPPAVAAPTITQAPQSPAPVGTPIHSATLAPSVPSPSGAAPAPAPVPPSTGAQAAPPPGPVLGAPVVPGAMAPQVVVPAPPALSPISPPVLPSVASQVVVPTAPMVAPLSAPMVPMVASNVLAAPILAGGALRSPRAVTYAGYVYPSNSQLFSSTSDLLANSDGRIFAHPALPGRVLYWNDNEDRWSYQDDRSPTGWFFVPREIYIPSLR